ncbi:unnamed protein product [Allacma fusca]|uniref:Phosphoacetylglucosamine mutase n=1 Tax=Allacma fusca TaxID=39272 RepID=A0A8J2P1E8_9HEXA|nr:unnamed protein product [Allacma fusca]
MLLFCVRVIHRGFGVKQSKMENNASEVLLKQYVTDNASQHPRKHDTFIGYGTAGFRTGADLLDHVMFRVGLISALRSKSLGGKAIGVMITASHNPEPDNGVKLVDPLGEMLAPDWEKLSTSLANLSDDELPQAIIEKLIKPYSIDWQAPGLVYLGRDTRPSSVALAKAVIDGIACIGCELIDFDVVSTPIVHYLVASRNDESLGEPTREGYLKKLSGGFRRVCSQGKEKTRYNPTIKVDGANGVGAIVMKEFADEIDSDIIKIDIVYDGSSGRLNHECGADFVKVNQTYPPGLITPEKAIRFISLDGDADRVIYFYFDSNNAFRMLDGDKIATLFAEHLGGLVKQSGLSLSIGLVQSAYANGSSTNYIQDVLGIPVSCAPTGVKYLHHEAMKYDIGIYFEANGHGTAAFSSKSLSLIKDAAKSGENPATVELYEFTNIINSTVGDAISDLLAVEAILYSRDWTIEDWDSKYADLPNKLMKVLVKDRTVITTADAERKVVTPEGVQSKIDNVVAKYKNGRSFVRPSGTEDVVRVYAEADTKANADKLCSEVSAVVFDLCGGVGARPSV